MTRSAPCCVTRLRASRRRPSRRSTPRWWGFADRLPELLAEGREFDDHVARGVGAIALDRRGRTAMAASRGRPVDALGAAELEEVGRAAVVRAHVRLAVEAVAAVLRG